MKYEIVSVAEHEPQKLQTYLDDGWEPFAVVARDTSYQFTDTSTATRQTQHQSTVYIYLRRVRSQ